MKPVKAVMAKLQRLRENPGARLRVLDLFAGCGGLSLGFDVAGYEIVAAMEIDELAARSHAINFGSSGNRVGDLGNFRALEACM